VDNWKAKEMRAPQRACPSRRLRHPTSSDLASPARPFSRHATAPGRLAACAQPLEH